MTLFASPRYVTGSDLQLALYSISAPMADTAFFGEGVPMLINE